MRKVHTYNDPIATAEAFGDYLMNELEKSDTFHCALSGGSTPKILFKYLAEKFKESNLWQKLHLYWGDERCVPPSDQESNFKMTKDLLISHVSLPEENIHRIKGEENPTNEARRYAEELINNLPTANDLPVFDMVILGMGSDGHTASIFPHQMELLKSTEICAVAIHPTSGQKRITLTGHVLNAANEVVFLVTGDGKKDKVSAILSKKGAYKDYPASHIEPNSDRLAWYLDTAAASIFMQEG